MRFCMVTTFYPPYHFGGDATYVRALSRALAALGHAVEVVHCVDAYRLKRRDAPRPVEDEGITVHRLASRFGPLSPLVTQQTGHPGLKSRRLREILARGFDVVHFHNVSLVGGPAILRWSRAPVTLYTLHEHWLLCPTHILWKDRERACDRPTCFGCSLRSGIPPQPWRYTRLAQRSVAAVDALLSPSRFTADRHRAAGMGPPIHVLPLFSAIKPPSASATPAPPARAGFLFVGRVTASKGIVPLLETFATLPDHALTVIGDGDLRPALEQRFAAHRNIRFLGSMPQADLVAAYRDAAALVFPSLAPETFGLSIVEAFACGTPAIVRDAGGARELVEETGGGVVYRTREELHAAIVRLAAEPSLRDALGRRARAGFLGRYTVERHIDDYLGHIGAIRAAKTVH